VRRLKFFPADGADPLWNADTGFRVNLDGLPLRDDTRVALRSWCSRWAILLDRSISAEAVWCGTSHKTPQPISREQWELAEREGLQLFERVQAELGPEWSVEFG
jgi:hypothetical protein